MKTEIIVGLIVFLFIAALVAALCKVAGRESRREEQEEKEQHPCVYCQRWGECNGVDEGCPLLQAYEEARSAIQQPAFFRGRGEAMKRSDDGG